MKTRRVVYPRASTTGEFACKLLQLIASVLILNGDCGLARGANNAPIEQFISNAWRKQPDFIDIKVKVRVVKAARGREKIRAAVTESFNSSITNEKIRTTRNTPDMAQINAQIDRVVEEELSRDGSAQYYFQRYRASGELERLDFVTQEKETWGPSEQFTDTRITGVRSADGVLNLIRVDHARKSCTLDTTQKSPLFAKTEYRSMALMDKPLATIIRISTGRKNPSPIKGEDLLEQDPDKTSSFLEGGQVLKPSYQDGEVFGQPATKIDFQLQGTNTNLFTVYCAPKRESNVFQVIVRDKSGKTIRTMEQRDFDANGFPHYRKETTHLEGGTVEFEERIVTSLELTNKPTSDVFEYLCPKGYLSASVYKQKTVFRMPDGTTREESRDPKSVDGNIQNNRPRVPLFVLINFFAVILIGVVIGSRALIRSRKKKP